MWISEWSYSIIHMKGLAVRKRFSGFCGFKGGGVAPDPSTQFSLFRLYIIEHPTFHSAQDDEMRREA